MARRRTTEAASRSTKVTRRQSADADRPKLKQSGTCPDCEKRVRPVLVQEGRFRDVVECPSCDAQLLICMMPSCENYARVGARWDDRLCPACWSKVVLAAKSAGVAVAIMIGKELLGAAKDEFKRKLRS